MGKITEIVCILDRSGSMSTLVEDTIGGFNSFISEQKKVKGDAFVTLVIFDNKYEVIYDRIPIQDCPELTNNEYFARGTTALLDAIGKTINNTTQEIKNEAIDKVIFAITTDGYENSSKEYRLKSIKTLVDSKINKDKWEFLFFGANIDAISTGGSLGFSSGQSYNYIATPDGINNMYATLSKSVTQYRTEDEN